MPHLFPYESGSTSGALVANPMYLSCGSSSPSFLTETNLRLALSTALLSGLMPGVRRHVVIRRKEHVAARPAQLSGEAPCKREPINVLHCLQKKTRVNTSRFWRLVSTVVYNSLGAKIGICMETISLFWRLVSTVVYNSLGAKIGICMETISLFWRLISTRTNRAVAVQRCDS